jgi:hypothetical protein
VEPPGGESGNIEHNRGMYNKPTGCSTPAYGAPHKQTNKQSARLSIKRILWWEGLTPTDSRSMAADKRLAFGTYNPVFRPCGQCLLKHRTACLEYLI